MKKKVVIDYFGGTTKVANALGLSPSSVSEWGERIPKLRAYEIADLTNGKLKFSESDYKKAS